MNSWKRLLPFLFLNIVISALTTLLVLWIWDQRKADLTPMAVSTGVGAAQPLTSPTVQPLPPLDEPVIKIDNIFGAGNPATEAVRLVGLGNEPLWLTGWKLEDGNGNSFTFPELELVREGAVVEVYSRTGHNTPFELYWNKDKSMWSQGETARLVDTEGNLRAEFSIP